MNWRSSVMDCGDRSPLSKMRYAASFQNADVFAHSQMLIRAAIVLLLLAMVAVCLLGYVLQHQFGIFHEFQALLLSVDWMLLVCLAVWCGTFLCLAFSLKDLPLVGLLVIAIAVYFIGYTAASREPDAIILLFGATFGKGVRALLSRGSRRESAPNEKSGIGNREWLIGQSGLTSAATFLIRLVILLAFASWWHLDMTNNYYHGPRWMGLWDNPNTYGMLMSTGVVLAIGLLVASPKSKVQSPKSGQSRMLTIIFLFIAIAMMGVGLVMSYSRGAWCGTAVGLLYLAWSYGKLKWRFVLPVIAVVAMAVFFFWNATPDKAPWYVKRMDLGRPSAQHRVAAWKTGFEMMRDHPFGVGWNNAVSTYEKNYSPPEGGAPAITTNDYLMLGTQLGMPALVCFVAYVALCFRSPKSKVQSPRLGNGVTLDIGHWTLDSTKVACRAGAVVLLVAFWFDGGLFTLATASVFWILLELGAYRGKEEVRMKNAEVVAKT